MTRAIFKALFVAVVLLLMLNPAQASRINSTDAAAQALANGAILWDVREADSYAETHISGAVNVGIRVCSELRTPINRDYVPIESIASLLGEWGIDPRREIVVYGDEGSMCPYFIQMSLELIGARAAHVYHGGIDDWRAADLPPATEVSTLPPLTLALEEQPGVLVTTQEVSVEMGRSDVQVLDVRTSKEFADRRSITQGWPKRLFKPGAAYDRSQPLCGRSLLHSTRQAFPFIRDVKPLVADAKARKRDCGKAVVQATFKRNMPQVVPLKQTPSDQRQPKPHDFAAEPTGCRYPHSLLCKKGNTDGGLETAVGARTGRV